VKPQRIVSLLPAATEAIYLFGLGQRLVGRSHECDHPSQALRLPALTKPRIPSEKSSAQIDQQVRACLAAGAPLYDLDLAKLRELKPDAIITQNLCNVCAFDLGALEESVVDWPGNKPQLLSLNVRRFAELWTEMRRLAEELGTGDAGPTAIRQLKEQAANVVSKACLIKNRLSVLCLEWLDPLMAAGHWTPDLVELAGGTNCFTRAGERSPQLTLDELTKIDPDVILIMPCGFGLPRARIEAAILTENPTWPKLRAVRKRRVFLTDGNQYFNRPGPRLVESLEILAEILQPDLFPLGWEKRGGWQRL
jgi:iron complex transport system substrate-binding protein